MISLVSFDRTVFWSLEILADHECSPYGCGGYQSVNLDDALCALSQTTALDGRPKYMPRVIKTVAGFLYGHAYAQPLFELCHLITGLRCALGSDYLMVFFNDAPVTSSWFRASLADAHAGDLVSITDQGLDFNYPDKAFSVTFSRMPVLAALFEVVLGLPLSTSDDGGEAGGGTLNPLAFFDGFELDGLTHRAVADLANTLARGVYGSLKDDVPSRTVAAKFQSILAFLNARDGDSIRPDDAGVLAFWEDQNTGDGAGDYRLYKTVADDFAAFIGTFEDWKTKRNATNAASLGSDADAGEVSPERLSADDYDRYEGGSDWSSALAVLAEAPAQEVKFLTKSDQDALARIDTYGPVAANLPLSLLRADVFGFAQAQILQARRGKDQARIETLIKSGAEERYANRIAAYDALIERLNKTARAGAHVLNKAKEQAEISADQGENVVNLFAGGVAPLPDDLTDDAVDVEASAAFSTDALEDAERAFAAINRKGFETDVVEDPYRIEAFRMGTGALLALQHQLEKVRGRLSVIEGKDPGLETCFGTDTPVFRRTFQELYGDQA